MKDVIAAVLMLGALVGVWFWIARKLRKKRAGGFVRHFAGGVCGFGALFVAGIFAAAIGLIEPKPDDNSADKAGTERSNRESAEADQHVSKESQDLSDLYTIVSDETMAPHKRTVEVIVESPISEEQLTEVAREIKSQGTQQVARTFIGYRLESQDPATAYWATTHYNPDLNVVILGLSPSEAEAYSAFQPAAHYPHMIGAWDVNRGFQYIAVVYVRDGQVYIDDVFPGDGTNTNEFDARRLESGGIRLQRPSDEFGEYFVVTPDGELEFWSENGNYFTAPPRDPDQIQLTPEWLNL